MIQEDEANGNGPEDDTHHHTGNLYSIIPRVVHIETLGSRQIQVDTGRERQQDTGAFGRDVGLQNQHHAEPDRETTHKIEGQSLSDRQVTHSRQHPKVGQFLGQFVVDGTRHDRVSQRRVAERKGVSDEQAVGKVVQKVADENAEGDGPVLGRAVYHDGSRCLVQRFFVLFLAELTHAALVGGLTSDAVGGGLVLFISRWQGGKLHENGQDKAPKKCGSELPGDLVFVSLQATVIIVMIVFVLMTTLEHVEGLGQQEKDCGGEEGSGSRGLAYPDDLRLLCRGEASRGSDEHYTTERDELYQEGTDESVGPGVVAVIVGVCGHGRKSEPVGVLAAHRGLS